MVHADWYITEAGNRGQGSEVRSQMVHGKLSSCIELEAIHSAARDFELHFLNLLASISL
jgi:hypothetical protein